MRYLVTSALPYANGPVHVGHLAGAYLPADIFTRFLKKKGIDAIHICGTDEHGVPITITAEKEKTTPEKIAEKYHRIIKEEFSAVYVEFENFSRTTIDIHTKLAQSFFLRLLEKGYIERRDTEQFYCPKCQRFLPDRYVEGTCPYCGYEQARGDQCERCGRWLEPVLLKNPRCKICGTPPVMKKTTHWYMKLNEMQPWIEEWVKTKDWKPNVSSAVYKWLNEGLKPRAITRDLSWGVPVPLDEAKGKVLYVWFDAPIGYISSTIEWAERIGEPEKWKDYWMDRETRLVHFIGKDNIVFHTIIWPAMLKGYGEFVLPHAIPANEFLNLEGDKISTSRNWAIWLDDFAGKFDPDYLRFYITMIMPETKDSNFSWDEFQERVTSELIDNFGNFVNRTLSFINKYMGGRIPHPGNLTADDNQILRRIEKDAEKMAEYLFEYRFRDGLKVFRELSREGNRYFDRNQPWRTRKEDPERAKTTLYISAVLADALADLGEIFIPGGTRRVKQMLGTEFRPWDEVLAPVLKGGEELKDVKPPYKKIDEEVISLEKRRFQMEYVTIDDFKKLGLKVGKVEKVDTVEGANKLYKLTVNLGDETRTLVAGLRPYYTEEELQDKLIVVITNLEPATIRGVKSEGMLLAADDGRVVSIVSPDKEVAPGSEVR